MVLYSQTSSGSGPFDVHINKVWLHILWCIYYDERELLDSVIDRNYIISDRRSTVATVLCGPLLLLLNKKALSGTYVTCQQAFW